MSLNTNLVAMLFFSNTNHVSLSTRIRFLDEALNVPEMVERFRTYRHPRIPVFRKHHDNIVGFIHAEDLLRLVLDDTAKPPDRINHGNTRGINFLPNQKT